MRISQEVKGVIMRNLCGTIFYIKTNVLQGFHICMNVPLSKFVQDICTIVNIYNYSYIHNAAIDICSYTLSLEVFDLFTIGFSILQFCCNIELVA